MISSITNSGTKFLSKTGDISPICPSSASNTPSKILVGRNSGPCSFENILRIFDSFDFCFKSCRTSLIAILKTSRLIGSWNHFARGRVRYLSIWESQIRNYVSSNSAQFSAERFSSKSVKKRTFISSSMSNFMISHIISSSSAFTSLLPLSIYLLLTSPMICATEICPSGYKFSTRAYMP